MRTTSFFRGTKRLRQLILVAWAMIALWIVMPAQAEEQTEAAETVVFQLHLPLITRSNQVETPLTPTPVTPTPTAPSTATPVAPTTPTPTPAPAAGAIFLDKTRQTNSASLQVDQDGAMHVAYAAFLQWKKASPYEPTDQGSCASMWLRLWPLARRTNPWDAAPMADNILQYESTIWATADLLHGCGIKEFKWPAYMMSFFALSLLESRLLRSLDELMAEEGIADFASVDPHELAAVIRDRGRGYNAHLVEQRKTLRSIARRSAADGQDAVAAARRGTLRRLRQYLPQVQGILPQEGGGIISSR